MVLNLYRANYDKEYYSLKQIRRKKLRNSLISDSEITLYKYLKYSIVIIYIEYS